MKILVPVKRVIDYSVRVRINRAGSGVETSNVKMSMNPFDEIALEAALQLQEAGAAKEIIAVSLGDARSQETLRTALAMGAERGILVQTDQALQPLAVAKILRKIAEQETPDLILMGKQAIDDDCNQTGQMLAGLLSWPQACFASKIVIQQEEAIVTREVDGGLETVAIRLPGVITVDLRLNQARYISLPNIMKAKNKPLQVITLETLGLQLAPSLVNLKVEAPASRKAGVKLSSVAELIDKLQHEAQVL